jgi:hypothetical protein
MHLHSLHMTKEELFPSRGNLGLQRDLKRVEVYVKHTAALGDVLATCVYSNSTGILLAFQDGGLATYNWLGKVRTPARPLGPAPPAGPTAARRPQGAGRRARVRPGEPDATASAPPAERTPSPLAPRPSPRPQLKEQADPVGDELAELEAGGSGGGAGGSPQPQLGVAALDYSERTQLLALVLADGSVAMCKASACGLSTLGELVFSHWACGPGEGAVVARIGAEAQLLAVGTAAGEVQLFRWAPPPLPPPGPS